jgi:penicillin-binding protein 1A
VSRQAARAKQERPGIAASQGPVPGYYAGGRLDLGWFATWAKREAEARAGAGVPGIPEVRTTLWPELQAIAARHLGAAIRAHGADRGFDQGAVVVMSPVGEVLAMVGGRDFGTSQWNNATQARRQPGSAFKLFVYLAALERGLTPADRVDDGPLVLGSAPVRNHDGRHRGPISLADAFALSSNPAAVRLTLGHVPEVRDAARRLGVAGPLAPDAGLALGVSEVTLLEMAAAYATVANAGRKVAPRAVVEVRDGFDRVVWCDRYRRGEQLIDRRAALEPMRRLLARAVTDGTGRAADPGFPAWGKTGTTNDSRDAWFVGFTDRFVAAVWVGNQWPTPMRGVTGGGVPARVWRAVMRDAHRLPPYRRKPCATTPPPPP